VVDVTASYVSAVTAELARCTEEYKHRLEQCQRVSNEIVNLWAQLGSDSSNSSLSISTSSVSSISCIQFNPQSDFDRLILENHNTAPEKIGLKQEILNRLAAKKDELLEEKQRRQAKINELRGAIEPMWQKLGKEKKECETFLRRNRGFSDKVIAAVFFASVFFFSTNSVVRKGTCTPYGVKEKKYARVCRSGQGKSSTSMGRALFLRRANG